MLMVELYTQRKISQARFSIAPRNVHRWLWAGTFAERHAANPAHRLELLEHSGENRNAGDTYNHHIAGLDGRHDIAILRLQFQFA